MPEIQNIGFQYQVLLSSTLVPDYPPSTSEYKAIFKKIHMLTDSNIGCQPIGQVSNEISDATNEPITARYIKAQISVLDK